MTTKPVRGGKPRARALLATEDRKVGSDVIEGAKEPKAPVVETIVVPAALMLAAESIAAKAAKEGAYHGVLLHTKDGTGKIVGFDGARLFVGSFPLPAKQPAWMKTGILLPRENLKACVAMVIRSGSAGVAIAHAKGQPVALLSDLGGTMTFQTRPAGVTDFPDYAHMIQDEAIYSDRDDETGEMASKREFEPLGFNSRHLKHIGEVAKILETALPKDHRDAKGMAVRVFDNGKPNSPRVFDVQGWPGALLVLEPLWVDPVLPLATVRMLAPAVKLTVAALRAHATRWLDMAAAATSEEEKARHLAKAEGFQTRVAAILARVPDPKTMIEGPKPEAPQLALEPATPAEKAAATKRRRQVNGGAATLH